MEQLAEITVPAAPSAAYAYLADFHNETGWRFDVDSSELQSGEAGTVGAVYAQRVTAGKRQLDNTVTVTGADGETVSFTTTSSGPMEVRGSYLVRAEESGSHITITVGLSPHGLSKLLSPLLRGELRRLSDRYSADLSAALTPLAD
jgi:Polyketide cyclase / dehydrase and lipid transport